LADVGTTRIQAVEFGRGTSLGYRTPLRRLATTTGGSYLYIDVSEFPRNASGYCRRAGTRQSVQGATIAGGTPGGLPAEPAAPPATPGRLKTMGGWGRRPEGDAPGELTWASLQSGLPPEKKRIATTGRGKSEYEDDRSTRAEGRTWPAHLWGT